MRFEITTEPGEVQPGDIVVFRLETKRSVKWTCGKVRCFTDDTDAPAIVLATGSIPEYDGYELICCIKSIPDVLQMTIDGDGEVVE
ncbi:hypothetical protein [Bifidobacterium biavatii]|uniref:Uncharacterized protein n=1 Tax=Bifidobacterium biavatii DSM 23969 TaxID=1437608 RepID=A0A087A1G8_9BIFI|nr:hypothetical protein [Bifidobacterium biavatii]KFI52618.1 hypothetical protein BBIA_0299 [Bifidobacterium biavatii DSM 23969]